MASDLLARLQKAASADSTAAEWDLFREAAVELARLKKLEEHIGEVGCNDGCCGYGGHRDLPGQP